MLRKTHFFILSAALVLGACGGSESTEKKEDNKNKSTETEVKLPQAKGDVNYGGVFIYSEDEKIQTLFPATDPVFPSGAAGGASTVDDGRQPDVAGGRARGGW